QYSYSCTPNSSSNPLFCFNYAGAYQDPSFIQDPAASGPWAVQLTYPEESQAASMWFSVPQNVANGFNVWFEFKLTPNSNAYATADGIAFVIQNAMSGGTDPTTQCGATGQGPTIVGGGGGCMGYGGIPNSVALEFDTYDNGYDPTDIPGSYNDNHIALQSCGLNQGTPNANSPAHIGAGNCLLSLGGLTTLISNPNNSTATPTPVTLADGAVHQVVMVYNGPLDSPANTLSVYLDPQFNPGTLTPVAGSTALFSGPFDITQYINLTSNSGYSPAYVGFTSATGSAFEQNELMGWTFTPHTTVSQQQPLNPPGTPTTFDFGTHSYTPNFPPGTTTNDITMGVIANTITPAQFTSLLGQGPMQYTGSSCQIYDDTGGKCIIYSVYCYFTDSKAPTACPAPATPPTDCSDPTATDCIDLTSSYNNSIAPTSPGYLQGDPLFSPITSISTSSGTATVNCTGECPVTPGQTVTILDANDATVATVTVQTVPAVNQFTFTTTSAITQSGGFLTSNNVQDIFISYSPQNIDGSTTGKTKNFSDFVVTAVTNTGGQMTLSAPNNNTATVNQADQLTATITVPATVAENGIPTNLLSLLPAGSPGIAPTGTVSFFEGTSTTPINDCGPVALTLSNTVYQATCSFTPTSTNPVTINAVYSGDPYHVIPAGSVALTVNPQTVSVNVATIPSGLSFSINGVPYTTAQSPTWNVGTGYLLATTSPQPGATGTQYVFSSWSDGGAISHSVQAPTSPMNYTASFTTQYMLSGSAGTGGTVSVANGYYNAQSVVSIAATPSAGYTFSGWTGGTSLAIANPASASTSVTMNGPETVMATFTPASTVSVSPSSIDFGTLYLGSIVTKTVTIKSVGTTPLSITDPRIAIVQGGNSSEFITLNLCPKSLAAGKSCLMTVTFVAGPFYTAQTAALSIIDSSPGSPQTVPLTATVINPRVGLSASSLNFGTHKVGTSTTTTLKITNTGTTTLSITNIGVNGTDPLDFSAPDTCPATLTAGASCTLQVTFTPKATKGRSATLVVTDSAQNSPQSVSLSGTGS
ncbi:MAG: choice-of-anchor D domain-containing protein, partial [Acidobacteriaceae bacterium]